MGEIKALLAALTQRIVPKLVEGYANGFGMNSHSRQANLLTGANRTTHRASTTQNRQSYTDYEDSDDSPGPPAGSHENEQLLNPDKLTEFKHLLLNHFRPLAHKITEEGNTVLSKSIAR